MQYQWWLNPFTCLVVCFAEFPCFVGASHLLGQLWLFCVGILIYRCGRLSFLAICGSLACKGVIRCFLRSWVACMQSGSGG
ncbi:hypothetical protein MtrunA17_Chr4g0073511 [Medicago truncatula]|uniref:Uncharacterized protein n=1 Tax=Medicago truncatula TaxID=3880 RepID=A0A396IGW1_MEDTR|nr:hypothetical protein MtrunA17_Chr4g0073511 [Medicago truncatula]